MISSNSHHLIDQVPLSPTLHKTASAEKLFQTHVHEPVSHRFFIKGTEITRAILEGIEEMEEYEDLQDILHLFQTDASKKRFGFPGLEVAIENFEEYIRGRGEDNKEFDFYKNLLPKIAQYALEATESELIERLPLIEMYQQGSFIVKPKDVRCILANAFFLNISSEIHNFMQKDRERDFGVLDFNRLYVCRLEESIERIICQLSYFYQQANHEQQLCIDREDIVFTRHNLTVEEEPNWAEMKDTDFSNAEETKSLIKLHDGRMEDILCRGFVDFANRFIHIGSIIPSLTQEEILFSCCPESFLTLLICESLSDTEIMTMRGMIRYSEYKGYLDTFEFTGLYEPLGHTIDIIIMDAISRKHFQPEMIKRDLNKAYLGFKNVNEKEITSGRWGCGAFGGDFCLKFVQQLCAAKLTGKSVYYSTFKDKQCFDDLTEVFESIISSKITIGELYYIMSTFHEYRAINSKGYFIDYLRQELQRKKQ